MSSCDRPGGAAGRRFFGEIAALTGVTRTAHVIADQPTRVLQVPAATLRHIIGDAQLKRLMLSTMTERMLRMNMLDLPRLAGLDQQALRELRLPDPARMPVAETAQARHVLP